MSAITFLNRWSVRLALALGLFIILAVNILRFYNLNDIPYGAQVDELAGAVTVQCLATEGIDAHKRSWPLFSDLNFGSPKPPTYLYPAVLWTKVFGYSIGSFRALIAFFFLLALLGLFFLGRALASYEYGFWLLLLGSISPWTWNFSRVSFESLTAVTFIVWGLFFVFNSGRLRNLVVSGILFALAMYAYPPVRMQMPLMLLPILLYRSSRGGFAIRETLILLAAFLVAALPLVWQILGGQLMTRFNDISIFSKEYLASVGRTGSWDDLVKLFVWNYGAHFKPDYLFLTGDVNYIHSTRRFGILSWVDVLGLLSGVVVMILVFFKLVQVKLQEGTDARRFIALLVVCILIAIVPAALTNEGLPHSLRTIGAWPFVMLLSGWGLWQGSRLVPAFNMAGVVLSGIFALALLNVYFREYPQKSRGMFGFWTREEVMAARTEEDWLRFMYRYRAQDYHFRYYLMNNKGLGCSQTRDMWFTLRDYLAAHGAQ
ncbi:MAG: hypothetical protein HGA80_09145 [Candidatus Omnitrophica bacterium]|nr:hypothetical protein [Candidatus Omnitrophota bacterium]